MSDTVEAEVVLSHNDLRKEILDLVNMIFDRHEKVDVQIDSRRVGGLVSGRRLITTEINLTYTEKSGETS